jgi:hypothetical protein
VQSANEHPSQGSHQSSVQSAAPPQVGTPRWPTAEEEKVRLFTQAQNNARIVQSYAQDLNDSRASHPRAASRDSSHSLHQGAPGRPPVISAGAALYSHAMASVNKPGWGGPVATHTSPAPPLAPHTPKSSRLPSAAEEKEMLRRYHDATRAVQQHHEANFGSSDGFMPSASSSLPQDSAVAPYPGDLDPSPGPMPDELPPPWVPSPEFSQTESLSEKERYRIAYEARERAAAAAAAEQQSAPPHPSANAARLPEDYYTAIGTPHPRVNDSDQLPVAAGGGLPPPWHPAPPITQSGLPPHLRARSPPVPPSNAVPAGSQRMLSAAEEKALLKARYEAEENMSASPPSATPHGQQEQHSPPRVSSSPERHSSIRGELPGSGEQKQTASATAPTPPRTPPPLRPRPPASYIQETAEEDARLQDELANGKLSATTSGTTKATVSVPASVAVSAGAGAIGLGEDTFGLLRPTSPFVVGWESIAARNAGMGSNLSTNGFGSSLPPSSPPPLPPKVPLGH